MAATKRTGRTLSAAQRVLEALVLVASSEHGITPKELAMRLQTSLSTAYYIIHTLAAAGFVVQKTHGVVSIGPTLYHLVDMIRENPRLHEDELRVLADQLSEATDSRAYVAVWDDRDVEIVYIRGRRGLRELPGVCRRFRGAAHALALGKVLLAGRDPVEWPEYLQHDRFPALTPRTITRPSALRQELERVAEQKVAFDLEEYALDSCCISVPICQGEGVPVKASVALAISVPSKRFWAERELLTGVLTYFGQQSPNDAHPDVKAIPADFRIFCQK